MLKEAIYKLIRKEDLLEEEMFAAMNQIMAGEATPALIGSFLTALRIKGETIDEITGAARAMRQNARKLPGTIPGLIDTCGTGGDNSRTFNISTTVAFVLAGAGLRVAKHGNRAMSGKCGSADLLEALGVKVDHGPEEVASCIKKTGIGFLFAPVFHTAMKHALGPRKELGFRTIFNLLGPLTNPAEADYQIVGVFDRELTAPLAEVLGRLGVRRCMVIHGAGGLDELSLAGPNHAVYFDGNYLAEMVIYAEELGLVQADNAALVGGDARENARITLEVLSGKPGPHRDVVLLNAAAAFYVAGLVENLRSGVELARASIDSGAAMDRLQQLQRMAM